MRNRKRSLAPALAMLAVLAAPAVAQEARQPSPAQAAQQQKMKDCNALAGAKNLKGDERKTFMSSCLSGTPAATTSNTQQQMMKECNSQATTRNLKGDQRKAFISTCLSNKPK
jgi:hypothetical protein